MRILAISNLFPPLHGGTFDFRCQSIVDALRLRGHEVKVLTSNHGLVSEQRDMETDRRLRMNGYLAPLITSFGDLKELEVHNNAVLKETIRDFEPEVVHVFSLEGISKSLVFALRNLKCPTVYDVADEWISSGIKQDPWLQWWNRPTNPARKILEISGQRDRLAQTAPTQLTKGYDRIPELFDPETADVEPGSIGAFLFERLYFISQSLKQKSFTAGFRVAHADIIYPGIPTELFFGEVKGISSTPKRFLIVSRLHRESGAMTVLEALRISLRYNVKASVTIFGRGESEQIAQLRSFVVENSLPVEFVTASNHQKELAHLYRQHDAFIYCAEWDEPFPTTILEAMASGLPVIASKTNATRELLQFGENAWTYTPGEAVELASRMQEVQLQPALRVRIAETAQADVMTRFSETAMMDRIEAFLRDSVEVWQSA